MKVQAVKFINPKGKVVEMKKNIIQGKYLPDNVIEGYEVVIKEEGLAWYEEKDSFRIAVKQIKSLNDFTEKDGEIFIMEKITDDKGISFYNINRSHTPLLWLECFRPATESEVLSLVYKPQQKVSKEEILAESNRLKDLFLNNKAECLVENEQEFRLVYDFLDKNCDKSLDRYLELDGSFDFTLYNNKFPIIIITNTKWGYLYGWNRLKDRDLKKPLIKFNGEIFSEVFE